MRRIGKDGDAIVVEITRYPDAARNELAGKVLKVLGDPEDPRTEIEKILACAVIPLEFPDDVARASEAHAAGARRRPTSPIASTCAIAGSRRSIPRPRATSTMRSASRTGPHGGPRVWVAVADVSHYVRWNDALDREAAIRGVSVYLPDRVIPMLPKQLSASICSLNPLVDRCAMVVRLDYTDDGDIVDVGYAAAAIRSKARLDYPGVAAALEGDFRGRREQYRPWLDELTRLNALAQTLRARRQARGALDLEIAEPKVVLDADDPRLVRDVVKAKGDPAVKQALPARRGVHDRRERSGRHVLPQAQRAHGVARPRAARSGSRGPARRAARRVRHQRRCRRSDDAARHEGGARSDQRRSPARRRCRSCCSAR